MTQYQDDPRQWSGPIDNMGDAERLLLELSMRGTRPQIDIDEALQQRWLEIWYQPKIDLRRKCLAGAEALARINHPTLGVLLPGSFLPGISDFRSMISAVAIPRLRRCANCPSRSSRSTIPS